MYNLQALIFNKANTRPQNCFEGHLYFNTLAYGGRTLVASALAVTAANKLSSTHFIAGHSLSGMVLPWKELKGRTADGETQLLISVGRDLTAGKLLESHQLQARKLGRQSIFIAPAVSTRAAAVH